MTPEIILKHYRLYHKANRTDWKWYQRGRRWPRNSYWLIYNVHTRAFHLQEVTKQGPRIAPVGSPWISDGPLLETFKSMLTDVDIARCARASIIASQATVKYASFHIPTNTMK